MACLYIRHLLASHLMAVTTQLEKRRASSRAELNRRHSAESEVRHPIGEDWRRAVAEKLRVKRGV